MSAADTWIEVDRAGLRKILDQRGRGFALLELIQNAYDEPGVTTVRVTLEPIADRRARWRLVVDDDAPDGFHDLTHSYRMFAESKKKADAEKRGRFNLGEKLVLAICENATVASTKGTVVFREDGRRELLTGKTKAGTVFSAVIEMTKAQAEEALARVRTVIAPAGIQTWLNGSLIPTRDPVRTITVDSLETVVADAEGNLRHSRRRTTVGLYDPLPDETASIYEMGIPVVENGDRWHYDVHQRVPLTVDRDNVTPAFLRRLRTEVANSTFDMLDEEDTKATWVNVALEDDRIEPEAVKEIISTRFGENAVVHDPNDPEADKLAMAEGRPVVFGSSLSKPAWENVRKARAVDEERGGGGFFLPAGRVTPSPRLAVGDEPRLDDLEWSDGMVRTADYARRLAEAVGVGRISVQWVRQAKATTGGGCQAAFGGGVLVLVLNSIGHEPGQVRLDETLIHEFAHHWSGDHFDARFLNAACRIGATMANLAAAGELPRRATVEALAAKGES